MMRHALLLLCLVFIVCAGCGETATGIAVSGTVTRAGKRVETGSILFVPKRGTKGQPIRAEISGGAYRVQAQEGLQAGHYILDISLTGTLGRKEVTLNVEKGAPQPDKPFQQEREITGRDAPIDIEL